VGRTIAKQPTTEWMCHECGYDMGEMFIECDMDTFVNKKDGFLVCPDCESTFMPSQRTKEPFFNRTTEQRPNRSSTIIVEHEVTAYCTTEIILPDGLTPDEVEEWEVHDDCIRVYFDRGADEGLTVQSFDLNYREEDYTLSDDINRTTVRDPDYNNEYWRSDY